MMYNPPHPGEIVLDECIKPLELSVTNAAKALGVARKTLSAIVNEKAGISADMAIRLERVFGSTAETWLRMQASYDLWHAEKRAKKWKPKKSYVPKRPEWRQ
jgi:antitoxin HigA-1